MSNICVTEVNLCTKVNKEMNFISFPNTLEILQNKGSFSLLDLISFQLNISSCFLHLGQQTQPFYFLPEGSYGNLNTAIFTVLQCLRV